MDMSRGASVSSASRRLFPTLPPLEKLIVRVAAGVMSCVCVRVENLRSMTLRRSVQPPHLVNAWRICCHAFANKPACP